ncbi:MAG: cation diffusion facilitator family transporter [Verrucomicrobiota bacterium]
MNRSSLTRFAWISIAAAIITISLKWVAYKLTGSVGLYSDTLESLVNLVGGIMALAMLTIAARPADEDHAHGHSKAEYFSSGVEGSLILIAAISIAYTAVQRLFHPQELEQVGVGLAVSVVASLVNLGVGLLLLRVGKKNHSITLEANAHHLLTDVWTSVGVVVGVGAVVLTGWLWLDAVVALLVAANIVWTGTRLVWRSISGLMDIALPPEEIAIIRAVLDSYEKEEVRFTFLLTRQAASRKFVSVNVLVPGDWTVQHGHDLVERIEQDILTALPNSSILTHLEPLADPK